MLPYFVILFAIGIAGMLFVVARHIREIFYLDDPTPLPTAGEVRILEHITGRVRQIEAYGKVKLKPLVFTSLTSSLRWSEQKLIALVRSVRKYQRELSQHAKVSPRESQYWKDISDWKQKPQVSSVVDGETASHESALPPDGAMSTAVEISAQDPVVIAPEVVGQGAPERPKRKRVVRRVVDVGVAVSATVLRAPRRQKNRKEADASVVDAPAVAIDASAPEVRKRTRVKRAQVDEANINPDNQTS